jgi:hypothetical protein
LTREAGTVELRRRLRNGLQARLFYTYAKSLDDYYSLSGQGSVSSGQIAQDWQHPNGQRALSTSDQRHQLNFTAQYTTGMGIGGKSLMSGWKGAVYKEWTVQTIINASTGMPFTPICSACLATGTGVPNTIRPNVVGSPYANLQPGFFLNPNAFAVPVGTFGNARRDSLKGPDLFSMDANMNRTFRLPKRYTMDAQLNVSNVLNHIVITSYNTGFSPGSTTFGQPTGAKNMRNVTVQLRLRF